ncbi:LPS export ABC transporter periplasmic protein LptC [Hyphomonas pacifica]|uniref:Uncharacterized protein n=1 Tax=Hyphomonas pacifica TaxID=1280941 RepID=A0A062U3I7_9PROT|nr:LPS export ABC transporter periplasmic protein LptC [Hyphomonas pacifica]KCZ52313.1 hypothetical protein HY2_08875 [Hyphomonas pacifica]RAN34793.1 hypothetical protein HY3_09850 [Hyphomonas pacifica]RAN36396.1 hypothetical protein HY11_01350 [Hyphomonas pacifica]
MDAVKHHDPASLWAPRRQLTLAQARQRSQRVRYLRLAFTACAAIAIGLFLGYIIRSAIAKDTSPVQVSEDETITMLNPRFSGRDSTGQSFQITADAARRRRATGTLVDLVNPVLIDETGSEISAPSGMYDRDAGILELYEDVRISDANGYTFMTSGARVFVGEGRVEGLSPLQGRGPLGDISCDTYEVLEDGNRVVCKGNVKTVIYPATKETPVTGEGEADGSQ